jgi:hypothetical protein
VGKTNRLLSFHTTWPVMKATPPAILLCRGNIFTQLLHSSDSGIHGQTHRHTQPTILLFRVFVAAGTCLSSRCLTVKGGVHFTKPWPSNDRTDTYRHRFMGGIYEVRRWDGLRCHGIYTKFHKYWFRHSKVNRGEGIQRHTDSMEIT